MTNFLSPKLSKDINIYLIILGFSYLVCLNSMFLAVFTVSIISAISISELIKLLFKTKIDFKHSLIFALGVTICLCYQDPAHSANLFQALEEATKKIISSSGNDGIDTQGITNFFIFIRVVVALAFICFVVAAAVMGYQQQEITGLVKMFSIAVLAILAVQFLTETIL